MTGCTYIIGAGIAAAIGYCIWRMYLNKRNFLASVQEDVVEGTLRIREVEQKVKEVLGSEHLVVLG